MRIAQITLDGNLPRYGLGLSAIRLSQALARKGDEVLLLCREANAAAIPAMPGVRVVPLSKRSGIFGGRYAYVRQVRRALAPGVDIVHVHTVARMAHWLLPPRARRGAPLVVSCLAADELGPAASAAGNAPERRARRHAKQAREVLARADAIVAPSRWFAGVVARRAARPGVVTEIGLGPADEIPPPRIAHEGFVVLALARFVPSKGLPTLVEAFKEAFRGDASARLVLAGEGPGHEALLQQVAEAGLGEQVSFPGYLEGEDRRRAIGGADVVAVPTLGDYETFCLAAFDASEAGVPIVVADGGALPERVEKGEGISVPSGDFHAFAGALRRIRSEPLRWGSPSGSRSSTAAEAPWDRIASEYRMLYARVSSRRTEYESAPPRAASDRSSAPGGS